MLMFGEEIQRAGSECLVEVAQEQSPKQARQHLDRKEEPGPARDPTLAVGRNSPAGNQEMDVWVMQQILSPGVQHTEEADLRTQMLWIGGDGTQRLRRRPE